MNEWMFSFMVLILQGTAFSDNVTTYAGNESLTWGELLEDWATLPASSDRHGRILALPPTQGYYVTERIGHGPHGGPPHGPHGPPPPPPFMSSGSTPPCPPPYKGHHAPPHAYNEWHASQPTSGGKIVNRPPNPYKDQFKPEYTPPHHGGGGRPVDRVDEPPRRQVSETDLYLLSAIEKLVYRVDLMEKRLRRMEESVHYMIAGQAANPEPCADNFIRIHELCYQLSTVAEDWKTASVACRKQGAHLLELDNASERKHVYSALLANSDYRGLDWWTGGLNPGLLWIWSHSARAVVTNGTVQGEQPVTVTGEGRCLALVHHAPTGTYLYRGQDCALKHRYICEKEEDKGKLSNDIERVAKKMHDVDQITQQLLQQNKQSTRKAKIMWDDDTV